jgi:hypothetical protein
MASLVTFDEAVNLPRRVLARHRAGTTVAESRAWRQAVDVVFRTTLSDVTGNWAKSIGS